LLRYFKECWSECQSNNAPLDDEDHADDEDVDDQINGTLSIKRRLQDKASASVTRDRNNNTRARKNYRQLAGLSDEEDDDNKADYIPIPSSKRVSVSLAVLCLSLNRT
jgi:hypothetical protein